MSPLSQNDFFRINKITKLECDGLILTASYPYFLVRIDDECVFGLLETGGHAAAAVLGMLHDVPLAVASVSSLT